MKKVAVILTSLFVLASCGGSPDKAKPAPQASAPQPTAQVAPPVVQEPATLGEAITMIKPSMTDETDKISDGALLMAKWSMNHLQWSDLKALPDSSKSLVMKDADEQRGKKICVAGRVIEIAGEKVGDQKVYEGGMFTGSGDIYRFIAVKSTGTLTEKSSGRFCGVVIGRQDYGNSVGGVAHAVFLVGMFDLPENTGAVKK